MHWTKYFYGNLSLIHFTGRTILKTKLLPIKKPVLLPKKSHLKQFCETEQDHYVQELSRYCCFYCFCCVKSIYNFLTQRRESVLEDCWYFVVLYELDVPAFRARRANLSDETLHEACCNVALYSTLKEQFKYILYCVLS